MDTNKIKQIIEIFENAKITSMDLEIEDIKIKLEKNGTPMVNPVVQQPVVVPNNQVQPIELPSITLDSPLVGTFYAAIKPNEPAFVNVGSKVKKGDVVCIIEAMKSMNEVVADKDGTVLEALVKDGDMVEYAQPLFKLGE